MDGRSLETRCIVLPPPNFGDTSSIQSQLAARGWRVTTVRNAHAAFAELCLRERAEATRTSWGLDVAEQPVVLFVDPEHSDVFDPMLGAMDRYLPRVGVFIWQQGQVTALRPPQPHYQPEAAEPAESESGRTEPDPPSYQTPGIVSGGSLRLTGEYESTEDEVEQLDPLRTESDTDDAEENETKSQSRLTAEELSMLLGGPSTDGGTNEAEGETER